MSAGVLPTNVFFAHSTPRESRVDWQPLAEHLNAVAQLAKKKPRLSEAAIWRLSLGCSTI